MRNFEHRHSNRIERVERDEHGGGRGGHGGMRGGGDHHHPGRGGGDGRGGRVFGHGGLRLVLLQLIADKPRHGYELIKEIGDRLGGSYSPSPGVIYPTLTLLEELGYTTMAESGGGRKLYTITAPGQAFLASNRAEADALLARMQDAGSPQLGRPPQVVRALENFKMAVRLRLGGTPLTEEQAHAFAQVLDTAAQNLERL